MGRGARRLRRRRVRRLPVHGQRRQRRRLGAPARLPPRRVGRRAARCLLRDGPGLGLSGLPLEGDRGRRLPLARGARAAQRRAVRRLPRRSPRRVLPHLRARAERRGRVRAAEQPEQTLQGERVLDVLSATGARIIAEDLGVIPEFVRETLEAARDPGLQGAALGARSGTTTGKPFKDPAEYPSGVGRDQRHARHRDRSRSGGTRRRSTSGGAVAPSIAHGPPGLRSRGAVQRRRRATRSSRSSTPSSSDIVLLPIHDVFGWRDRINTPAVISDDNWTWRLPWPVEDLREAGRERARSRASCERTAASVRDARPLTRVGQEAAAR